MKTLPKWHRKAPAKPVPVPNTPKPWRKDKDRFDPWAQNDDGTAIPREMRCVEPPEAGLKRVLAIWPEGAAAPIVEGVQADGSVIEVKTLRIVPPKRPPVIPRPNVGKVNAPGVVSRQQAERIARRSSSALLGMIDRKRDLMRGPQMIDEDQD